MLKLVTAALLVLAAALSAQPAPDRLQSANPIHRALSGGESHSYAVGLQAGQFLQVRVTQSGVDILVRLFGPDGQKLAEVDANVSLQGEERLFWVAQVTGDYRLQVEPGSRAANPGRYEIKLEERRASNAGDVKRVAAQQSFREAQNWAAQSAYDRALRANEQALSSYRDVHDRQGEAGSLNNLGDAYYYLSQFDKAIGCYEQALAIFRGANDRHGEASSLTLLGSAYFALSQYEKAVGFYERALAIRHNIKDRRGEAGSLGGLGNAYAQLSQYERAIGFYERALAISRETKDHQREANSLIGLGIASERLSQYEKSIGFYEQALAIYREMERRDDEAASLIGLGNAYSALNQYEKAIGFYEQSLKIFREIKDRDGEAMSLNNLADRYRLLGQQQKAIGFYQPALTIARETKDLDLTGHVLSGLGSSYRGLHQSEKAISFHMQALAIKHEIKARSSEATTLEELMLDWQASAQPRLAIFYGKQAVNMLQSIRSDISGLSRESQQSFVKGNEESYHALANLLISQGRLPEAQQVLNLLKEEEYFEFVRRDSAEATGLAGRASLTSDEAEYEKRYREIGDRLVAIGAEHGTLLAKNQLTPEETQRLAQVEKDLEVGNAAFQQFLGNLAKEFSGKPGAAAKLEQVRDTQGLMEDLRELPAGTVAIYTLIGEDKYRAILITPDVQKAYEYPIAGADLNRKILLFRQAVQDPSADPRPLGEELYKILLGNMAEDLKRAKAQTLMWSLDGALRYVPLVALYDGKRYLIEEYRTSVFTPASNARLKDRPDKRWTAVGFGVTKAQKTMPALPSVTAELNGIIHENRGVAGGVLQGDIKIDEAFTEGSMRDELRKRFPAVHIASHFSFQPGDETKSALLTGDGNWMTLSQIKKLPNLFSGVQVLTLSACNTGVGDNTRDGKEVEGFGVLAQRQGAKAVIASLWPVADASTSRLMQEFYRIREASDVTKLEALRQAQLGLLAQPPYTHPFFWAPFFLMGNWL